MNLAFETLQSADAFDVGVDMICDIILESSKEPLNQNLITTICPFLNELLPLLRQSLEDTDMVRGLCRIFVEAGEG